MSEDSLSQSGATKSPPCLFTLIRTNTSTATQLDRRFDRALLEQRDICFKQDRFLLFCFEFSKVRHMGMTKVNIRGRKHDLKLDWSADGRAITVAWQPATIIASGRLLGYKVFV